MGRQSTKFISPKWNHPKYNNVCPQNELLPAYFRVDGYLRVTSKGFGFRLNRV
jgi:hypothetical protein